MAFKPNLYERNEKYFTWIRIQGRETFKSPVRDDAKPIADALVRQLFSAPVHLNTCWGRILLGSAHRASEDSKSDSAATDRENYALHWNGQNAS